LSSGSYSTQLISFTELADWYVEWGGKGISRKIIHDLRTSASKPSGLEISN
jgi:hypothetical protein